MRNLLFPLRKGGVKTSPFLAGFTLLELLLVIIVLGILASVSLVNYGPFRENTLDKEAESNLRLIIAAERFHRVKTDGFIALNTITDINDTLHLRVPSGAGRNWDYTTQVNAGVCCAQATRLGGNSRNLSMRNTDNDPVSGACP